MRERDYSGKLNTSWYLYFYYVEKLAGNNFKGIIIEQSFLIFIKTDEIINTSN